MCSTHAGKTVGETVTVDCKRCTCPDSTTQHSWTAKSEYDPYSRKISHTWEVCTSCYDTRNDQYFNE